MISSPTVTAIMQKMKLLDVVLDYITVKHLINRMYVGDCPFCSDSGKNLRVNASAQIFKCFTCGKSGNAITFIMFKTGCTFKEALRTLALKYDIPIEEVPITRNEQMNFSNN